eukprot:746656-Hanusia_phi.AAC.3
MSTPTRSALEVGPYPGSDFCVTHPTVVGSHAIRRPTIEYEYPLSTTLPYEFVPVQEFVRSEEAAVVDSAVFQSVTTNIDQQG